jgi:aspartokinase
VLHWFVAGHQAEICALQGASKTNISLIVSDEEAAAAVRGLHCEFFESHL